MGDYGFSINVKGNSIQEMKRIESELQRLGIQAKTAGREAENAFQPVTEKLSEMKDKLVNMAAYVGEAFAVREVYEFGKKILETTSEFEGFANRIKFASLNSYDASVNMGFLRQEVEKLHMPIRQAYEGFSEMEAGLVGTGIQGDRLRQLFDGLATAAATLHISEFNQGRMLLDFKEIGEIGLNRRIFRSLSTALPGLNQIIREAFGGKSWDDLEKEGLSGTQFLAKIGPALTEHFKGGLDQFANSLQAKMTDVSNHWTEKLLEMGDKLRPFFTSILSTISGVLQSGPFQAVINNIDTLATGLLHLIGIWITYKGLLLTVTVLEKGWAVATSAMTVVSYTASFGVQGLTYSLEQMGISLAAIASTVAVFSLAVIIEQFESLNMKIINAVDNITKFRDMTAEFKSTGSKTNDVISQYELAHTDEDKSAALGSAQTQLSAIADEMKKVLVHQRSSQDRLDEIKNSGKTDGYTLETKELRNAINGYQKELGDLGKQMDKLNGVITALQKAGIKPPATNVPLADNGNGSNLHGSHLAGAEGGLNQARIVNLHIDQVMHIETHDNRNLKEHAEQAAGYVIRALNNISESKSGTQ